MPSVWEDIKAEAGRAWDGVTGGLDNPMAAPEKPAFQNYFVNEEARKSALDRAAQRGDQLGQRADQSRFRGDIKVDENKSQQSRGRQMQFLNALGAQARGEGGPSQAQAALQGASDKNMRQALAMANSGRGNPALAQQAAQRQIGQAGQETANSVSQLRNQEMQQAQAMQGSMIQGLRGQDMTAEQSAMAAALQQQAQRDNMEQFFESGRSQQLQGQTQADLAYEGLAAGNINAANQYNSNMYAGDVARQNAQFGGLMGAGGAIGGAMIMAPAASDERMKKNVSNVDPSQVNAFFKALASKEFEYKNPKMEGASEGKKVGFMAGDVENTELGQKLFKKGDDGLSRYDPQVMDGILAAAIKNLMEKKAG